MFNYQTSKNLRLAVLLLSGILLVLNFFTVEYDRLFSEENLGAGLRFFSNVFVMVAMLVTLRPKARKE